MTSANPVFLDWITDWADRWNAELAKLCFEPPACWVYNPWNYAREGRQGYFGLLSSQPRVFMMGMNPGPWGMAQNGVPFGEREMVLDWLGLSPRVGTPESEHPQRRVKGMQCERKEVSGSRVWGLMRDRFGTAEQFFTDHVILPYCPLMWLKASGANLPPNVLPVAERRPLEDLCDRYLDACLAWMQPEHLVAIGVYAEEALQRVRPQATITRILHPSPASPAANRDWAGQVTRTMVAAGIWE